MTLGRLLVVAGPTGTGKSELGLELAERLSGEIVNADSMQLYRGMDIGTAKLSPGDRRGIPHHQLDVLDVTETASVATYQHQARADIERILAAGRTPILVGGSGLYIGAVIDEISFPGTDPVVRARWEAALAEHGGQWLYRRLADLDPVAAAAIEPGNHRRIVRALEVIEISGQPFTASLPVPGPPRYDAVMLHIDRPTEELDGRLSARVDAMMAAGFEEEVRTLEAQGLRRGVTAGRGLGYRQLLEVIDGRSTRAEAVAATVAATRRFVRRQRSWFGRDQRWVRLPAGDPNTLPTALRVAGHSAAQHPRP